MTTLKRSLLLVLAMLIANAHAFAPAIFSTAATQVADKPISLDTSIVITKVAVAGATGRTGKYVVQELLDRNVEVVAMVRDLGKAQEVFGDDLPGLDVMQVDLTSQKDIDSAVSGCDAAIWCATGFSDSKDSFVNKLKKLLGMALAPKQSIDAVGVPALAKSFSSSAGDGNSCPKVVMLSSAGVTRPSWSEEKQSLFPGSAEIPIVRLNPFGILNIKADSEEALRQSGIDYCIVRPAGLNDDWPSGARPILTQGDVAVGRINRKDVAGILVDVLSSPEATGKTFEAITVAGYPPAQSLEAALKKLKTDKEGPPSLDATFATYTAMQQLLPGQVQDSAGIALGQTYDELDEGKEGRFGKRGEEAVERVPMKPTS